MDLGEGVGLEASLQRYQIDSNFFFSPSDFDLRASEEISSFGERNFRMMMTMKYRCFNDTVEF